MNNTPLSRRRLLNLVNQQLAQAEEMNGSKHPDSIPAENDLSKEVATMMRWFVNSFYTKATGDPMHVCFFTRQSTRISKALCERRRTQLDIAERDYAEQEIE